MWLVRLLTADFWLAQEQENIMIEKDAGAAAVRPDLQDPGLRLFVTGFLVLFLELACIRWFATYVIFLQFFTNVVLLASFLGMSCGCMAGRSKRNWLALFPLIALGTVLCAVGIFILYASWSGLAIDVGNQASPQEVFFGTEIRNPDVATFAVPIEAIVGVFFVLIALMFVPLGQVLGSAFDAIPNRVKGYALNIGGSIVGIVLFSLASFVQTPPVVWFAVTFLGVAWLLHGERMLNWQRLVPLVAICIIVFGFPKLLDNGDSQTRWSPYYAVNLSRGKAITVNTIGHQMMLQFDSSGSQYSLIHLLHRAAGETPFKNVLIIGAGSGNDIDHALHYGVSHVDAVEIDPVILDIGVRQNPDHPYQDPRVTRHLDDGRHFLRTTDQKYDLVVYALVDSLVLHSGYSNIRLESYLFTQQAFDDIKRVLNPGGMFVTYNYFRQGWVVQRVADMAKRSFGCDPLIISLPYREEIKASAPAGFTMVMTDCSSSLREQFRQQNFWINTIPPKNLNVNGFQIDPRQRSDAKDWLRIAPSTLIADQGNPIAADDDWPFPYLSDRIIPELSVRSMVLLGGIGLLMVWLFWPRGSGRVDSRMFFLGAAFMLLETRAVVQLALLFGSTWVVNSGVFFTVLVLILLANLYALRTRSQRVWTHYALLLAVVAVAAMTPVSVFLNGGLVWRTLAPCILALGPMLFAAVIFARSFSESSDPDLAFASNIAGSVVGGIAESFSMLLGFRYLLLLAVIFYLLSMWRPAMSLRTMRAAS
jgi:SAM-dependent methyltransferase